MTLKDALYYTEAALKTACFDKHWVTEIPKFIKNLAKENFEQSKNIEGLLTVLNDRDNRIQELERLVIRLNNLCADYGLLLNDEEPCDRLIKEILDKESN